MSDGFKVQRWYKEEREMERLGCPVTVPWKLVLPHWQQAHLNHYQTLQRLNERGGLTPREMIAVVEDKHWREVAGMSLADAVAALKAHLAALPPDPVKCCIP